MNRAVALISIAAAFAAGCGATHLLRPALAAENITAQIIHVPEMNGDALGLASGTGLRSRTFVAADGATVAVQDGNVPKHMHLNANEMQYILEGTGDDLARRQGSAGEARRSCHYPQGYAARRHQA